MIKGKYKRIDEDTIQILELPIGTWTTDYKQFLEDLIEGDGKKKSKSKSYVKDYVDMSTDRVVDFTVIFKSGMAVAILSLASAPSPQPLILIEKFPS